MYPHVIVLMLRGHAARVANITNLSSKISIIPLHIHVRVFTELTQTRVMDRQTHRGFLNSASTRRWMRKQRTNASQLRLRLLVKDTAAITQVSTYVLVTHVRSLRALAAAQRLLTRHHTTFL